MAYNKGDPVAVSRRPTWVLVVSAAVTIFALGLIDWQTGYELNFFVFYFAPIAMGAWELGFAWSVALSVLAAMVWAGADVWSGHTYSLHVYAVWNTTMRLISFLTIGWSVSTTRKLLDAERGIASDLRRSMSEIKVLESFLPICAACKKIRNQQGEWQVLESYIGEHANTQFSHGYCPECLQHALEEAGMARPPPQGPAPGGPPPRSGA